MSCKKSQTNQLQSWDQSINLVSSNPILQIHGFFSVINEKLKRNEQNGDYKHLMGRTEIFGE